ncbi:MAG: hypothetical protein ACYTEW_24380 [Planctomycetota bacterium]|jgi:hypothetical protein
MTILVEYFKRNKHTEWNYVGTIYGTPPHSDDGLGFSEMLSDIDPQAEMVDHPAYGGADGFYIQSDDIWYTGEGVQELVFEAK